MRALYWKHCITVALCSSAIVCASASDSSKPSASAIQTQRAFLGDLNGDGVVDVGDLRILLMNYGMAVDGGPLQGDLNGDGVVDREDVRLLLSMFGSAVDDEDVVRALAESGVLDAVDQQPQPQPPQSPWGTHHPVISNNDHSQAFSQSHPNHDQTISHNWPGWPGGHDPGLSIVWPPNHSDMQSAGWPPTHNDESSQYWPPTHSGDISGEWPPDAHDQAVSITWPPSHSHHQSSTVPPGNWDHGTLLTQNHPPDGSWPTYHSIVNSINWGHHTVNVSSNWPPNHFKVITVTWDPNNHDQAVSTTWPPNYHEQSASAAAGVHSQRQSGAVVIDVTEEPHLTQ